VVRARRRSARRSAQFESLNRLSTFVLHDIKNQVSGLTLVVENARRHITDPEFQRDAMRVIERTVSNPQGTDGTRVGRGPSRDHPARAFPRART
jgi:hypothetical protein